MPLCNGSEALAEFKQCVVEGYSIRKIRVVLEERGYSLKEYSDVDLIRLWREYSEED